MKIDGPWLKGQIVALEQQAAAVAQGKATLDEQGHKIEGALTQCRFMLATIENAETAERLKAEADASVHPTDN